MSRQIAELEAVLRDLIAEHRKLLEQVESHAGAMKAFDLATMDQVSSMQRATHGRITALEVKRKAAVRQVAAAMRVEPTVTLSQLAVLYPPRRVELYRLRDELKAVASAVAARNRVAGKVANALLGHLNTVVRLFAGAVAKANVYTKYGVPQVSRRIGVMEAIG